MKIKAYKTEDEIPEGAVYMSSVEEQHLSPSGVAFKTTRHYFLVNKEVMTTTLPLKTNLVLK